MHKQHKVQSYILLPVQITDTSISRRRRQWASLPVLAAAATHRFQTFHFDVSRRPMRLRPLKWLRDEIQSLVRTVLLSSRLRHILVYCRISIHLLANQTHTNTLHPLILLYYRLLDYQMHTMSGCSG